MTDNKRNSVNAKVATPRTAGSSPVPKDTFEALSKATGGRVKITTTAPLSQTLEGSVFTVDPILNVVAIDTSTPGPPSSNGASQSGDYHIIPVLRIQSFQLLSPPSNDAIKALSQATGPLNIKRAKERAEARVNKLKEEEASRGKGVTKEAQAIFDALKRVNIPIRWHGQQMIVHDAVIILPPYQPENCKASKDKQQVVNQVKKVLEGERRKLKEREEREKKADAGQRKGG